MFRLLSKQAAKAVRRPRLPLYSHTTPHGIHSMQAPYSGPPSYETIARRFSSPVDPQTYFNRKHEQEAIDRGEFLDYHDLAWPDPRDYDILIPDIDHGKLRHEISEVVGIPYLSPASKEEAGKVINIGDGFIYGKRAIYGGKPRTIFPGVVSHKISDKASSYWVFLLVDTASPLTYLSAQTSDLFGIKDGDGAPSSVAIAGHWHGVYRSPANSHFAEVDILGMDFIRSHNVSLWYDSPNRRAKLYIGTDCWEVVGKPKM